MLQQNATWTYPDIDPVHDKVAGCVLLARTAREKEDIRTALRHYATIFNTDGFNGASPFYAPLREEYEMFLANINS